MQSMSTNSIRLRDFSKTVSSNNERAKSKVPSGTAAKDTNLVGGTSQATLPAIVSTSPNNSSMTTTTNTRSPLKLGKVLTSKSNIWDFGFSRNGRFAFVDGNEEVNIWDQGKARQFKTSHKFKSHLIFSPDRSKLLLYSEFPLLCEIWKIDGRDITLAKQFEQPVNSSAAKFPPDGRRLAMEVIWRSDLLEKVEPAEGFRLANYVMSCELSPDGRWLVVEYYYGGWAIVILEHDEQGKVNKIQKFDTKRERSIATFSPNMCLHGGEALFDDSLRSKIAFSPDGRLLVLSNNTEVEAWRIGRQGKLHKIQESDLIKQQLETSLNVSMRHCMLWNRNSAEVQIWKLDKRGMRGVQKFEGSSGCLRAVIPLPDSQLLALAMTTEERADQLFHDNLDYIEIWEADEQGDFGKFRILQ